MNAVRASGTGRVLLPAVLYSQLAPPKVGVGTPVTDWGKFVAGGSIKEARIGAGTLFAADRPLMQRTFWQLHCLLPCR